MASRLAASFSAVLIVRDLQHPPMSEIGQRRCQLGWTLTVLVSHVAIRCSFWKGRIKPASEFSGCSTLSQLRITRARRNLSPNDDSYKWHCGNDNERNSVESAVGEHLVLYVLIKVLSL
jgi:hypothetical protein